MAIATIPDAATVNQAKAVRSKMLDGELKIKGVATPLPAAAPGVVTTAVRAIISRTRRGCDGGGEFVSALDPDKPQQAAMVAHPQRERPRMFAAQTPGKRGEERR